jgi:hypothetical protein
MKFKVRSYTALLSIIEGLIQDGIEFNVFTKYHDYPYFNDVMYYEIDIKEQPNED